MIVGALSTRTRILVTHQLDILHRYPLSLYYLSSTSRLLLDSNVSLQSGSYRGSEQWQHRPSGYLRRADECWYVSLTPLSSTLFNIWNVGLDFSSLLAKHVGAREEAGAQDANGKPDDKDMFYLILFEYSFICFFIFFPFPCSIFFLCYSALYFSLSCPNN